MVFWQAAWYVLVFMFWASCYSAKYLKSSNRVRRLRALVPACTAIMCCLILVNQFLFWKPIYNDLHGVPENNEILWLNVKAFASEMSWYRARPSHTNGRSLTTPASPAAGTSRW